MSRAIVACDAMREFETAAATAADATGVPNRAGCAGRRRARERLTLTHTLGVAGWQVRHQGDAGAFVLAALGRCFIEQRSAFNLPLLWRLHRLWREGAAALEPRALRLALWLDERVELRGTSIDVHLAPPAGRPKAFGLGLRALRERGPEGQAPARVFGLTDESHEPFRRMTRDLGALPKGSALSLRIEARHSSAPAALRARFPLRVDLRLSAGEGYVKLIHARTVEARLPGS